MRFERCDGGFEIITLVVADRVFGAVPNMLNWIVIRRVGWETDQVNILQRMALGEFVPDEWVLMPGGVIPYDHDPFS